jgi:hypothetical protein
MGPIYRWYRSYYSLVLSHQYILNKRGSLKFCAITLLGDTAHLHAVVYKLLGNIVQENVPYHISLSW